MNMPAPFNALVHPAGIVAAFVTAVVALILAIMYRQVALFVWAGVFLAAAVIGLISGAKAAPTGSPKGPRVGAKFKEVDDWAVFAVGGLFIVGIVVTIIWPPIV